MKIMHLRIGNTGSPSLQFVKLLRDKILTKFSFSWSNLLSSASNICVQRCAYVDVAFDKYYPRNTCAEIKVNLCKHA